jgi:hypothetical protein
MYCLFCVVLCIVFVYMCTELLPPGGYPIAVKYIISYEIRVLWSYQWTYFFISVILVVCNKSLPLYCVGRETPPPPLSTIFDNVRDVVMQAGVCGFVPETLSTALSTTVSGKWNFISCRHNNECVAAGVKRGDGTEM